MILEISKQLTIGEVIRITNVKNNIDKYSKIFTPDIFFEDLKKEKIDSKLVSDNFYSQSLSDYPFLKNIGNTDYSKYDFNGFGDGASFQLSNKKKKYIKPNDLYLGIRLFKSSPNKNPSFDLEIRRERNGGNLEICFGAENPNSVIDEEDEKINYSFINFATYFYNKKPLYKRILETLISSKSELEKNFGKEFAKDIIALFSAEYDDDIENIQDFIIPKESIEKKWYTGASNNILSKHINSHVFYESGPLTIMEISLNPDNVLLMDFTLIDAIIGTTMGKISKELLSKLQEKRLFESTIERTVNMCFKNMVAIEKFQESIIHKFPSKLLVSCL